MMNCFSEFEIIDSWLLWLLVGDGGRWWWDELWDDKDEMVDKREEYDNLIDWKDGKIWDERIVWIDDIFSYLKW